MGEDNKKKKKKKKIHTTDVGMWFSLCKSQAHHLTTTADKQQLSDILARKPARSGCSRSIANLKDVVIHGSSKRQDHEQHQHHPNNSNNSNSNSPRSIGSSDFLINPITHHLIFTKSNAKITTTPTKLGFHSPPIPTRSSSSSSFSRNSNINGNLLVCQKCGHTFPKLDSLENHHFSTHSVTDLPHGDSSRKIIEIICKSTPSITKIDRVLKIHNSPKAISRFEAYRESVKLRASKLPKKHPRCLADGNELLRFHGARLGCNLSSGAACNGRRCSVCRIIRGRIAEIGVGVFTASTSGRALEAVGSDEGKKAVVVCRVIAGRVHRPVAEMEQSWRPRGFDSVAGKLGVYANIEELYLLNPKALLPCFLVICDS